MTSRSVDSKNLEIGFVKRLLYVAIGNFFQFFSQFANHRLPGSWSNVEMSSQQFDPSKMKPNELRVQYGALQKELEYREKAFIQRGEELERAYNQVKQRESELQQKTTDVIELKVKLEAKTVELGQRKKPFTKITAIIVSVLFGVTNVLFNLANNMMGVKPPDPNGNVLMAIAAVIYLACAVITIFVLGGGI